MQVKISTTCEHGSTDDTAAYLKCRTCRIDLSLVTGINSPVNDMKGSRTWECLPMESKMVKRTT